MTIQANAITERLMAVLGVAALHEHAEALGVAAQNGIAHQILDAVENFHLSLLMELGALDPQLAIAYGLGRAFADSALLSTDTDVPGSADDRLQRLRLELNAGRVSTLTRWLASLASDLPSGVADAVSGSLSVWATWVDSSLATSKDLASRFNRQADRWRDLLTGHADLKVLGSREDEVTATSLAFGTSRRLAWQLVVAYKFLSIATLAIVVAMVSVAFSWSPSTGKALISVGAVLTALGASWKSLGASLSASASAIGTRFGSAIEREQLMLASLVRPPGLDTTKKFVAYRKALATAH